GEPGAGCKLPGGGTAGGEPGGGEKRGKGKHRCWGRGGARSGIPAWTQRGRGRGFSDSWGCSLGVAGTVHGRDVLRVFSPHPSPGWEYMGCPGQSCRGGCHWLRAR
ncbi:unnamed protein product, partial [Discosporangium mesarthrocarpum]